LYIYWKGQYRFSIASFFRNVKGHGNFVLPDNVPANEFLNLEGDKILPVAIGPFGWTNTSRILEACKTVFDMSSPQMRRKPKDNDFTWKDFQERNNSELVAIFGNFVNRTFVLMHKLTKGKSSTIPQ
jgi:methionyl-tRNA synthetase